MTNILTPADIKNHQRPESLTAVRCAANDANDSIRSLPRRTLYFPTWTVAPSARPCLLFISQLPGVNFTQPMLTSFTTSTANGRPYAKQHIFITGNLCWVTVCTFYPCDTKEMLCNDDLLKQHASKQRMLQQTFVALLHSKKSKSASKSVTVFNLHSIHLCLSFHHHNTHTCFGLTCSHNNKKKNKHDNKGGKTDVQGCDMMSDAVLLAKILW